MAIRRPQPWEEIENDDRFKQLTPDVRLQVFNNWTKKVEEYGNSFGGFIDEAPRTNFQNFVTKKSGELSSQIPKEVGTLEGIVNAASNAWDSSRQALMTVGGVTPDEAKEISKLEYNKQARNLAPGYKAYQEAEGWDAVKAFATNPIEVTTNIVAEGLAGSVPALAAGTTAGLAGAAALAPTGLGAAAGFLGGQVAGTFAGSLATEYGSKVLGELQEAGMDLKDPNSIVDFFSNEQLVNEARNKGLERGIPVAALNAVTAGIGGRVASIVKAATKAPAGTLTRKVAESGAVQALTKTPTRLATTELGIQAAGGGLGEVAGAVVAGEPIEPKAVFAEVIGEAGPGIFEIAQGRIASRKAEAKAVEDKKISETLKVEEKLMASGAPLTAVAIKKSTAASLKADADRVASMVSTIEQEAVETPKAITAPAPITGAEAAYREERPPTVVAPTVEVEIAPQYSAESLRNLSDEKLKNEESNLRNLVVEAQKISATSATTLQANLNNIVAEINRRKTIAPTAVTTTPAPAPTEVPPAPAPTEVPPAPAPTEVPPAPAPTEVPPAPAPAPAPTEVPPAPAPTEVPTAPAPTEVPPAPAPTEVPPAPAPAPAAPLASELQAPNPDAQAYEDELVNEALSAGTKVPQRTVERIRKDLKGTGWYPGQYQAEIRKLRERVKARLEAAPTPTPAAAPTPTTTAALPVDQETLVQENVRKGAVPSAATIKSKLKEAAPEQQLAVRKEGVRRLASSYGIEYSDALDMVRDFEKKDSLPVRMVPSAQEGVSVVEPVFVNNPDVTARQIDSGFTVTIPENMRNRVAPGITFDPATGQVTSAQSRGFTVQKLGELAKQVRDSRIKVEGYADINSEADMAKVRAGVQKLSANKDFKPTLLGVIKRLAEFNTDLPITDKSILETKALSIWVDGQLKNKPVDPATAWKFAERKLAPKLAVRVQEESMQAAYTEGGKTLEDVLPSEEPSQEELDTEAEREAAVAAAAAETGEVYKPEVETGKVVTTARASRISYDRAKALVDNPKPPANLGKAAKAQFAQFLQEAKDLLEFTKDIRAQLLKDGVSAKEYGTWTYDDFANVDVGNTGTVLESSTREDSPYIREQIAWFDNVASQLGVPDAGFFTPEQFTAIAKYYADKYRIYFDSGNVTLPPDSAAMDIGNIQKLFEKGVGQASVYRTKLQELQESYPGIRKIVYSTKRLATAWYDPKYPGMVFFNPVQLEREIAGLTESEAFPILRAIMDEEYDHYITIGVISPQQAADISDSLDDVTLQKVLDEYVPANVFETAQERQATIDELMRNPSSIGYEYLRMIRQRIKRGLTTEDLTNNVPQSVKDKIFQMLRALINKLKTRLLVYRDPVLARTIEAIESGYRVAEIREEIRKLSPEDQEVLQDDPKQRTRLFSKPKFGVAPPVKSVDNIKEAGKIRTGTNYWVKPDGSVVDIYEEVMGRVSPDDESFSATHGGYIKQWIADRLRGFWPDSNEVEMATKMRDAVRRLMNEDTSLQESISDEEADALYSEEAYLAEALGQEPPDRDAFVAELKNKNRQASPITYVQAAQEAGWARVSSVPHMVKRRVARSGGEVFKNIVSEYVESRLGTGARKTLEEVSKVNKLQNVPSGALRLEVKEFPTNIRIFRDLPDQDPWTTFYALPGKRTRGSRSSDRVFTKGGIFSSGLFTPKQRDIILAGKSAVAAANNEFKFTLEALDRSVKKAYGKNPPTDIINRVLGSTENPLTDAQVQDLADYAKTLRAGKFSTSEINEKVAARKAVFRNDNQNAQRAQIAADLATLDPNVAKNITSMRQKLDALSTKLIEGGYIAQGLIPVFEGNMELYLHRNYAIYNNPIWKEYMTNPQTAEHMKIRTAFEKLATDRAVAEKVVELRNESRKADPTKVISVADAKKEVQNNYADWVARRVDEITTDFLNVADEDSYKFFVNGTSIPGKRRLDILKVRGQLPKEVRDFWGEEKDIKINFAQAAGKMASFISATDTARNLLENGISEGFIWKKNYDNRVVFNGKTRKYDVILGDIRKEGFDTEKEAETWRQAEYPAVASKLMSSVHPKGWVPLIKKGTNPQSIAPLDGAYGPPELRDALNQAFNPKSTAGWANWFSALSLLAMSAKTIGYIPRSVVRNFLGNPLIVLSKGMFNLSSPLSMVKSMADGFKVAGLNVGFRGEKLLKAQPLMQKLVRLGVVGDTISGGLLKQLYEDNNEIPIIKALYSDTPYDSKLKNIGVSLAKKIGKAYNVAADIYQGVDDIWKVYAWEQERMNQARANPGMTDEQLDEAAAYVVRNTLPTYSLSPEITKELRRIPVLAPFITWTSEVLRTTSNGIAIANSEIKEGLATKNKAMYANGMARWAGLIGALGIIPIATEVAKYVFDNTDEDDEAVRNLVRDWQKNSEIMLIGKPENGKVKYVDLSYLDPFQVFKEPIIAAMRGFNSGDNLMKVAYDTGREALRPVLSEQLFFGAVLDAMRNQTADGMRITNPQDTAAKQTYDKIKHVAAILTPGVLADTIPNILKGAEGKISRSGKVYSLSNELYSAALGQKISEMDAQTSLRQKMGAYKRGNMDATSLFTETLLNRGSIEPGDVIFAYENANRAKKDLFDEMKKAFDSAVQLGVSVQEAAAILTGQGTGEGLSRDLVREIISGEFVPYIPSNVTLERVVTRPNGNERLEELRNYLIEKQRNQNRQ